MERISINKKCYELSNTTELEKQTIYEFQGPNTGEILQQVWRLNTQTRSEILNDTKAATLRMNNKVIQKKEYNTINIISDDEYFNLLNQKQKELK